MVDAVGDLDAVPEADDAGGLVGEIPALVAFPAAAVTVVGAGVTSGGGLLPRDDTSEALKAMS